MIDEFVHKVTTPVKRKCSNCGRFDLSLIVVIEKNELNLYCIECFSLVIS